jgi:hypothetical protein
MALSQKKYPGVASGGWSTRANELLTAAAESFETAPFLPFYFVTLFYTFVCCARSTRPLWYDELVTYYIAKSPTRELFFSALARIDMQPPLQAALTMLSLRVFGDSNLAARIPSIIAFWIASSCLYRFVGRKLGRFYGLAAMLALWSTEFFMYAFEARPYALVTAFLAVAMISWQHRAEGSARFRWLLGIAFGVAGLLTSHVFGSLALVPLGIAEIVSSIDRKKVDWKVWAAFFAPAPLLLFSIKTLNQYGASAVIYPPAFQASILKAITFYRGVLFEGSFLLLIALAAGVLLSERALAPGARPGFSRAEIALCSTLLVVPIVIDLLLMGRGTAFWPRYGIPSGLSVGVFFAVLLAKATQTSRLAAAGATTVIFAGIFFHIIAEPFMQPTAMAMTKQLTLEDLNPKLPLVTASGLAFVEMNKREDNALLSHVYYLTDRESATRFAHATLFESFELLEQFLPVRAHVTRYREFIRSTPHFLVLCTLDYPEDWLIPKLMNDGAHLQFLGEMPRGYNSTVVFDVNLPTASRSQDGISWETQSNP